MPFEKGNKIGHRFTADHQPPQERRSGGRIDRVKLFLESVKCKPLTADEVAQIDASLLNMTREELAALIADKAQPIIVQARAKQLYEKATTFEGSEKLLDRAFGKPTIRTENQVEGGGIVVNYQPGAGKPARNTEEE